MNRRLWFVVALAVLAGVFFRGYNLDRKAFWEDEMLGTMRMLGHTEADLVRAAPHMTRAADVQAYLQLPERRNDRLSDTVGALAAEDPQHPPLYYALAHLWSERFGTSPLALRALPALFGVLALPCVFWLGCELFGSRRTAALATALCAAAPVFVLYAQEAREYSLWTVAVLISSALFLRACRSGSVAAWAAYAASLALGLYVYPLTALVAAGHGAFLIVEQRFRFGVVVRGYLLAVAAAALAFAPWLAVMLASRTMHKGIAQITGGKLSPAARLAALARDLRSPFVDLGYRHAASPFAGGATALLTLAACGLVAYAAYALVRTRPFRVWGFVLIALCLPFVPLFFDHGFVYQTRYFMPLLLGSLLATAALLAAKLEAPRDPRALRAWSAAFAALLALQIASCWRSSQADTWWTKDAERARAVAASVDAARAPLVVSRHFVPSILSLAYYLDPRTPVRLDVRCSSCTVPTPSRADMLAATDRYGAVFELDVPQATPRDGRIAWIDPRPFPPAGARLTMFERE